MNSSKVWWLAAFVVLASACVPASEKFTLICVPDTQRQIKAKPGVFINSMEWIAANKDEHNIKFVMHTGDLVDWDTPNHEQFATAANGYGYLDRAGIFYAISPGNHDTGAVDVGGGAKPPPNDAHINVRDTINFNNYFPSSKFPAMRGQWQAGKVDNAYHTFTAGGLNWMVITLEFCPRAEPVQWAKNVVAAHPNHNVIFVTHYYMEGNNAISTSNAGYGDNSGKYIFDQVVKQYANVRMVFSGHVGVQGYRTDIGVNLLILGIAGDDGGERAAQIHGPFTKHLETEHQCRGGVFNVLTYGARPGSRVM